MDMWLYYSQTHARVVYRNVFSELIKFFNRKQGNSAIYNSHVSSLLSTCILNWYYIYTCKYVIEIFLPREPCWAKLTSQQAKRSETKVGNWVKGYTLTAGKILNKPQGTQSYHRKPLQQSSLKTWDRVNPLVTTSNDDVCDYIDFNIYCMPRSVFLSLDGLHNYCQYLR